MPDTWEGWEDSAVPVPEIGNYLRDLRKLLEKYQNHLTLYGHFGQGCVHTRIPFDLYTRQGIEKWRAFIDDATDLEMKYGGSFSGEHGDGQSRGEWLGSCETKTTLGDDTRANSSLTLHPPPLPYLAHLSAAGTLT
jgi:FAD/FMN-containing dehydrogenase